MGNDTKQTSGYLAGLDIETECAVEDCPSAQVCQKEKHALLPQFSRITLIGLYSPESFKVWKGTQIKEFEAFINLFYKTTFVGHKLKFDIKHLAHKGVHIPPPRWAHCTALMATANYKKIPKLWMEAYENKRLELNKALTKGYSHRAVKGGHSLKVQAPYFLDVPAFWENPENHNDVEYLKKDCKYSYDLCTLFTETLKGQDTWDFYLWLLDKDKRFLEAELRGIRIDTDLIEIKAKEAETSHLEAKLKLQALWKEDFKKYNEYKRTTEIKKLGPHYENLLFNQLEKLKEKGSFDKIKTEKLFKKYGGLEEVAKEKIQNTHYEFNMGSPKAMGWMLGENFKLDISARKRDKETGEIDIKDSTGVEILNKLYDKTKREDIKTLLDYRKFDKLSTSFYPTYKRLNQGGYIHCNFHLDVTRTGRTSASDPNLQQVPSDLHRLYIARPGYKFQTYDFEAIEPTLICYYVEDPILYNLLTTGKNFHNYDTNVFFGQNWNLGTMKTEHPQERSFSKELGLQMIYGSGVNRVKEGSDKYGFFWSKAKAREVTENFRDSWSSIFDFKKKLDKMAESKPIRNLIGMKRDFTQRADEIHMRNFNGLIQGGAGQLLLHQCAKAVDACRAKGYDVHQLLWVHDEGVFEIPEAHAEECSKIIKKVLTDYPLPTKLGNIPLKVEGKISDYWEK